MMRNDDDSGSDQSQRGDDGAGQNAVSNHISRHIDTDGSRVDSDTASMLASSAWVNQPVLSDRS